VGMGEAIVPVPGKSVEVPRAGSKIKVLVVDDSAIVRKIVSDAISAEEDIEVVGTAPDPYIARDKILALNPDVLTLDIEMPRMDGLTFLKKLMQFHPMPVVVISSMAQNGCQAAFVALRLGAVEVLAKPCDPYSVGDLRANLAARIRTAACARLHANRIALPGTKPVRQPSGAARFPPKSVIAIGASTGGPDAIERILMHLPAGMPGMVITQHIPQAFSLAFANRLNQSCAMEVREARDGDVLSDGLALIAPGNQHMILKRAGAGYQIQIKDGPQVCYQRPSVDVLFGSVAESAGRNAIGILLTGMGADGANGLLQMKNAGASTIAQDEASCVVFGMPKEAIRLGAADRVVSLAEIPSAIVALGN
jgi:two-component system, chemotaxis family, protein-glutamate methylesterase/glutaminase